jgi:hypothetical protein
MGGLANADARSEFRPSEKWNVVIRSKLQKIEPFNLIQKSEQ